MFGDDLPPSYHISKLGQHASRIASVSNKNEFPVDVRTTGHRSFQFFHFRADLLFHFFLREALIDMNHDPNVDPVFRSSQFFVQYLQTSDSMSNISIDLNRSLSSASNRLLTRFHRGTSSTPSLESRHRIIQSILPCEIDERFLSVARNSPGHEVIP